MTGKTRVLVIEDDPHIRKYLKITLEPEQFQVFEAETARIGLQQVIAHRPDLILLDLGLPDQDGQSFLKDLREWNETPVIVLSAREMEADKIQALESGADDYLTKPFSAGELMARIKVALRHAHRVGNNASPIFQVDGLNVDLAARRVVLDGVDVRLTPIEFKLLTTLIKHAGKVLTHAYLLNEVWGKHAADNSPYLRIHTQHLREKLNDNPLQPRFIFTEPGIGYRFKSDQN